MKQTNLDPFFEVKECSLYFEDIDPSFYQDEPNYEDSDILSVPKIDKNTGEVNEYKHVLCPRHKAIVAYDNKYVFACFTENYRLVTNQEAVDFADILAKRLFDCNSLLSEKITKEYSMSEKRSQVSMKFYNKEIFFSGIDNIKDVWYPEVIITNSYNGTISLSYDFGFKLMDDDVEVVFKDFSFFLKINKNSSDPISIREQLENILNEKNIISKDIIIERFKNLALSLFYRFIPKKDTLPLLLKLFKAEITDKSAVSTLSKYASIKGYVDRAMDKYFVEPNLYYYMKALSSGINSYYKVNKEKDNDNNESTNIAKIRNVRIDVGALFEELAFALDSGKHKNICEYIGNEYYKRADVLKNYICRK